MRGARLKKKRRAWNCVQYVVHHPLQNAGAQSRCVDCGDIIIKVDGSGYTANWVTLLTVKEWP